jgi:ketosteroid isomerase-like protein
MSRENVEAVKRFLDAYNRQDVEAMLEELDPEVEYHPALPILLGGEATLYRGHEGVRRLFREIYDAFDEIHVEYSEFRDLGDRVVGIGRVRMRGKGSGAETEAPTGSVVEFKNGKGIRVRTYLDPKEALEAAGLSE